MKHLISLKEQTKKNLLEILKIASTLKNQKSDVSREENKTNPCKDKRVTLLFEKNSTRTTLSSWYAACALQSHSINLDARYTNLNIANFKDEMKAMLSFSDILIYRSLDCKKVELAASLNIASVVDACSNKYHPMQAISDIFTMAETSGGLSKVKKIVWLGIENNVSNTLAIACAKIGIHIYIVSPLADPNSIDKELNAMLDESSFVHRTPDIAKALENADYVHTDTWVNMEYFEPNGTIHSEFKEEFEKRKSLLVPYQLSADLLKKHKCKAKIMHCMPCHEGYEITRDAIDHPNSVIFEQAENRYHTAKAVLWWLCSPQQNT